MDINVTKYQFGKKKNVTNVRKSGSQDTCNTEAMSDEEAWEEEKENPRKKR